LDAGGDELRSVVTLLSGWSKNLPAEPKLDAAHLKNIRQLWDVLGNISTIFLCIGLPAIS
jgi:hypothetical protein